MQDDGGLIIMKRFLIILLIIILGIAGCSGPKKGTPQIDNTVDNNVETVEPDTVEKEIVLYFANSQAQFVVPEYRTVKADKDITEEDFAKLVLEELIKGPNEENLYKTIPGEVKVLNVEIQEDTILIDFSREMYTKHWGGAAGEDMTISSLVNTMTELKGIKKVLLSVEGMALNIEHVIVDEPLERMEDKIYR